jgi:hypothetical protein
MAGLITVQELKAYPLPVTDKQWEKITDEQIEVVIGYASENIEDFCDRHFASDYYAERIVGSGSSVLILEHYPITQLVSVESRDYAEIPKEYELSSFIVHGGEGAGMIEWVDKRLNAFWKNRVWVVEYQAGYSVIPGPVKHAVALQTIEMLQPLFRGGMNFTQVETVPGITEQMEDMLFKYVRKRIG